MWRGTLALEREREGQLQVSSCVEIANSQCDVCTIFYVRLWYIVIHLQSVLCSQCGHSSCFVLYACSSVCLCFEFCVRVCVFVSVGVCILYACIVYVHFHKVFVASCGFELQDCHVFSMHVLWRYTIPIVKSWE